MALKPFKKKKEEQEEEIEEPKETEKSEEKQEVQAVPVFLTEADKDRMIYECHLMLQQIMESLKEE